MANHTMGPTGTSTSGESVTGPTGTSTSGEIVALNFLAEIGRDDFTFKAFVECTPRLASLLKQDSVIAPLVKEHEASLEGRFF
jgi:hypothetical protein